MPATTSNVESARDVAVNETRESLKLAKQALEQVPDPDLKSEEWHRELAALAARIRRWTDLVDVQDVDCIEAEKELHSIFSWCDTVQKAFGPAQGLVLSASLYAGEEGPGVANSTLVAIAENTHQAVEAVERARHGARQAYRVLAPMLVFAAVRSDHVRRFQTDAKQALETLGTQLEDARKVLGATREVMAEKTAANEAKAFREQGDAHDVLAGKWLNQARNVLILLLLLAAAALVLLFLPWTKDWKADQWVQLAVAKVTIVTILTTTIVACFRAHAAEKHNAAVNKHRAHVLGTYKALVESAGTAEARAAVLAKVTENIFSMHSTGFVKTSAESTAAPTSLVQLVGDLQARRPPSE